MANTLSSNARYTASSAHIPIIDAALVMPTRVMRHSSRTILQGGSNSVIKFNAPIRKFILVTCTVICKENWHGDVSAILEICRHHNLSANLESSLAGNGAHASVFFDTSILAANTRRMGMTLLTEGMERLHGNEL
jgi:hypothetical protein